MPDPPFVHGAPVISISQPIFNMCANQQVPAAPPGDSLSQTDDVQAGAAPLADGSNQKLQQPQAPVAQVTVTDQPCQPKGVQLVQPAEDFESWRPVTSVPFGSSTAAASEANVKSVTGLYCSGAHALTPRQSVPCNHQVLCC